MTLHRVLLLDTETTGLDPATARTIEVAGVEYDLRYGIVSCYSSLIPSPDNPAAAVNGIPVDLLRELPATQESIVWRRIEAMVQEADAICAHRAEFDQGFVPAEIRDLRPWICTKFDIEWPRAQPGARLTELALALGLGISHAHRALTDCITMARIFDRVREMGFDLSALLARGLRPKATFQALVSFQEKDLAKDAKFSWEPTTKRWLKTMAVEDAAALPFPTRQV